MKKYEVNMITALFINGVSLIIYNKVVDSTRLIMYANWIMKLLEELLLKRDKSREICLRGKGEIIGVCLLGVSHI